MNTFDEYYETYFKERWNTLKHAMLAPHEAFPLKTSAEHPYFMDTGSVLAGLMVADALQTYSTGTNPSIMLTTPLALLDACSAPGGKALVLAQELTRRNIPFTLLANELSSNRRRRLKEVLETHCNTTLRSTITVSGFDAARAGSKKTEHHRFSGILLDVPCSSERHVINDANARALWTPARIENLSQRQWALLSSAYLLAKETAVIAYVTCALTDAENDAVIARALQKYGENLTVLPSRLIAQSVVEKGTLRQVKSTSLAQRSDKALENDAARLSWEITAHGIAIMPDTSNGAGPLFISLLLKRKL